MIYDLKCKFYAFIIIVNDIRDCFQDGHIISYQIHRGKGHRLKYCGFLAIVWPGHGRRAQQV